MADMDDFHDDFPDELHDEDHPLEAYCVKCKDMIEMEDPQPVWTRKGTPGTRGFCPVCGTVVFRMGRTAAHKRLKKPRAVRVVEGTTARRQQRPTQAVSATYVNYADADAVFVHRLVDDLQHMGVQTWMPYRDNGDYAWAGGVHPALEDCTQMLLVLSAAALADTRAQAAWVYFREKRKKIVVARREAVDVPDDLRRAPRVDFTGEYRQALRALVQALAE
jgi:hypothetical protein